VDRQGPSRRRRDMSLRATDQDQGDSLRDTPATTYLVPSRARQVGPICLSAKQAHPERGLRTQIGGLVQLSFQEVE
jgi:hypothetical protein